MEAERRDQLLRQTRASMGQLGTRHRQLMNGVNEARQRQDDAEMQMMVRRLNSSRKRYNGEWHCDNSGKSRSEPIRDISGDDAYLIKSECATYSVDGRCLPLVEGHYGCPQNTVRYEPGGRCYKINQ
jgi:hypothetical protein